MHSHGWFRSFTVGWTGMLGFDLLLLVCSVGNGTVGCTLMLLGRVIVQRTFLINVLHESRLAEMKNSFREPIRTGKPRSPSSRCSPEYRCLGQEKRVRLLRTS